MTDQRVSRDEALCERHACPDCSRMVWDCDEHYCDVTRTIQRPDTSIVHDETLCADCHEPLKMRTDARRCFGCDQQAKGD